MTLPGMGEDALDRITLEGEGLRTAIPNLGAVSVAWPIDAAPTLEFEFRDPDRRVMESGRFNHAVRCSLDGIGWKVADVKKTGTKVRAVFEHAVVAALRAHTDPRYVAGGTMSRLAFARMLCAEEPWITVVSPLGDPGPVTHVAMARGQVNQALLPQTATTADPAVPPAPDAPTGDPSAPASAGDGTAPPDQFGTVAPTSLASVFPTSGKLSVDEAAQVAYAAGFRGQSLIIVVAIGGAESGWTVDEVSRPNTDGTVDRGWLQINSVHAQYDPHRLISDPLYCAQAAFELSGGSNFCPWSTYEGPPTCAGRYHNASYRQHLGQASEAVNRLMANGEIAAPKDPTTGKAISNLAQAGAAAGGGAPTNQTPESTWDALGRLFGEVGWRRFVRGVDELWIMPDAYMVAGPRNFVISESLPGVDTLDFDWDTGKPQATASATVRARAWSVWPGYSVLFGADAGPAAGIWLVSNMSWDLGAPTASVDFLQPQPELPEPPADSPLSADATAGATADLTTPGGAVVAATDRRISPLQGATQNELFVAAAERQEGKPYQWGGAGPDRFDCSGLVQYCAKQVGMALDVLDLMPFPRVSGAQYQMCKDAGTIITVDGALAVPGALLWPSDPGEHVAISKGDGRTVIEAPHTGDVVRENPGVGRFTYGGLIPGMNYGLLGPPVPAGGRGPR